MNIIALKKEFIALTLELLRHKYRYYILFEPTISDTTYDFLEKKWERMGQQLGLDMDNYPHWVGFDEEHPLAPTVIRELEK